jgi:hypothetical protein
MNCFYWIHTKSMTNIKTEGYVGVTTKGTQRWKEHLKKFKSKTHYNKHLQNAY